jgi:hypothetical protein
MRVLWILLLVLAGSIAGYMFTRFEREAPAISTRTDQVVLGKEHAHEFRVVDDGTGVERIHIWLEAGEQTIDLVDVSYAGNLFTGASLNIPRAVEIALRPEELGVSNGPALLVAEARDFSWLGNVSRVEIPLLIDTRAPRLSLLTGLTYARRGGTELVVYRVDEETVRDGVEVGDYFFRGYPHPQDPKRRVAFYALPPGTTASDRPRLVAEDRAGNLTTAGLNVEVIERSFPDDQIELSQTFMASRVAELLGGEAPDDLLEAYLKINREMRAENAHTLLELCTHSSSDRLWSGSFSTSGTTSRPRRRAKSRPRTTASSSLRERSASTEARWSSTTAWGSSACTDTCRRSRSRRGPPWRGARASDGPGRPVSRGATTSTSRCW